MSMKFGFNTFKNVRIIRKVHILNGQPSYIKCKTLFPRPTTNLNQYGYSSLVLYMKIDSFQNIPHMNEREKLMQETQHTQQTATRTAQNQVKKTT